MACESTVARSLFVRWRNKEEKEECSKNFIKRSKLTSKGQPCPTSSDSRGIKYRKLIKPKSLTSCNFSKLIKSIKTRQAACLLLWYNNSR